MTASFFGLNSEARRSAIASPRFQSLFTIV